MKCVVLFALLAVAFAQNNFQLNSLPVAVTPGVPITSGFSSYGYGSQFYVWVPSNASRVHISWIRSASDSNGCSSSDWTYLYGKWASYPCPLSYSGLSTPCYSNSYDFGSSTSETDPVAVTLDAYQSDLHWWYEYEGSGSDFLRGDYLYLGSYIDEPDSNCTATLNVTFDYCSASTVVASDETNSDSQCVSYTTVPGVSYTENNTFVSGPGSKYWMVTVPANSSGINFVVKNANTTSFYLYARASAGGDGYHYYDYEGSYDTESSGLYNYTLWVPNPPAGQFLLSVEIGSSGIYGFDVEIMIKNCPTGMAADRNGACLYPLTYVTSAGLTSVNVNVGTYNSAVNTDCNWQFLAYPVTANTYAYMNLTATIPASSSAYVYWRRDAVPNYYFYDDYFSSTETINFTPEDFYLPRNTTYYFGFCNYDSANNVTISVTSTSQASGPSPSSAPASASPSTGASASPSTGASASPSTGASASPSPDMGSSSDASSLVVSLLVVLVCVVLLF